MPQLLCASPFLVQFDKEYSYNIRHSYGQEGRRKSYDSYNCVRIITSSAPQAGDAHGMAVLVDCPLASCLCQGCPFKHSDATSLKAKLKRLGVPTSSATKARSLGMLPLLMFIDVGRSSCVQHAVRPGLWRVFRRRAQGMLLLVCLVVRH